MRYPEECGLCSKAAGLPLVSSWARAVSITPHVSSDTVLPCAGHRLGVQSLLLWCIPGSTLALQRDQESYFPDCWVLPCLVSSGADFPRLGSSYSLPTSVSAPTRLLRSHQICQLWLEK